MTKRVQIALFAMATAASMTAVSLQRVLAVLAGYEVPSLILTAAMGAFAIGAASIQLFEKRLSVDHEPTLFRAASFAFSISIIGLTFLFIFGRFGSMQAGALETAGWMLAAFLAAIIFFGAGFLVGFAFAFREPQIGQTLLIVFGGGALGALIGDLAPLLIGGVGGLLFCAIGSLGIGLATTAKTDQKKSFWILAGCAGCLFVMVVVHGFFPYLLPHSIRNVPILSDSWSPVAHVALVDSQKAPDTSRFLIDGAPVPFTAKKDPWKQIASPVHALPFHFFRRPGSLAVGSECLAYLPSLIEGSRTLTWLDPANAGRRLLRMDPGLAVVLDSKTLTIESGNPNHWLADHKQVSFDLIHLPALAPVTTTAVGPFRLPGELRLTQEALHRLLDRLAPGGALFSFTLADAPDYALRTAILARSVLEQRKESSPEFHLFAARDSVHIAILVKAEPFSIDEVSRLLDACQTLDLTVLYSPFTANNDNAIFRAATVQNLAPFIKSQTQNAAPPTDNRPTFFYTRDRRALNQAGPMSTALSPNLGPGKWRAASLFSLLLLLLVWIVPLFAIRAHRMYFDAYLPLSAFFALTAMATAWITLGVLHLLLISMADPFFALTFCLPVLLLAFGIGSTVSQRWLLNFSALQMRILLVVGIGAALFIDVLGPTLLAGRHDARGWLPAMALLFAWGAASSLPLPPALNNAVTRHRKTAPWMFSVYAAGFLLGLALAPLFALAIGYTTVLLAGTVLLFVAMWLYP